MLHTESRHSYRTSNILPTAIYVCTFQPGNFYSEWVNGGKDYFRYLIYQLVVISYAARSARVVPSNACEPRSNCIQGCIACIPYGVAANAPCVCGPRVSPIPFGLSLVRGDEKSPLFSYSSFILREWGRWGRRGVGVKGWGAGGGGGYNI